MPWKDRDLHRERIREISRKAAAKRRVVKNDIIIESNRRQRQKRKENGKSKAYYEQKMSNLEYRQLMKLKSTESRIKNKDKNKTKRLVESAEFKDSYILRVLEKMGLPRKIAKQNPLILEAKRLQLKIKNLL